MTTVAATGREKAVTVSLPGLTPGEHVYRATCSGGAAATGSTGRASATVPKK